MLFEQALFNILDNAAKYAGDGGSVAIRLRRDERVLRLTVKDSGPGIPAEDVEAVFEKFHRVRKGDHVRPGTGLGLAISRGFVEAVGGTVVASNAPGGGAMLTIRLPLPGFAA